MKINLFNNLWLKILSIVIAFLLWVYFAGETMILKDVEVPLNIVVGPERALSGDPISSATIRVRGTETAIARLTNQPIYSNIDLRNSPLGEKFIQLSPGNNIRGVPSDIEIVSITPDRIKINVENLITRWIPVVPQISGTAQPPYMYYGCDAYPSSVMVEGAQSIVNQTDKAVTEVIDIGGRNESFRTLVDVLPENPRVRLVNQKPVTVFVKIDRDIKRATFEALPITFTPSEYSIVPSYDIVSLRIEGPESIIEKVHRSSIIATVSMKGLKPSNMLYQLTPHFSFASLAEDEVSRIAIQSWSPETISVKINPARSEK